MGKPVFVKISVILLLLTMSGFNGQVGHTTLKAVFIERVSRFIDWPENIFDDNTSGFKLTVVGKHNFGQVLDQIYTEYKIKDRNVEVSYVDNVNSIDDANIIFVGELSENQLSELIKACASKPILIISDDPDYIDHGLMMVYYLFEENIKFDINLTAVKQSGLQMSYHLLNRANVYEMSID